MQKKCYNPLIGTWRYVTSLSEHLFVMGVATLDALVYMASGYNGRHYFTECTDL